MPVDFLASESLEITGGVPVLVECCRLQGYDPCVADATE